MITHNIAYLFSMIAAIVCMVLRQFDLFFYCLIIGTIHYCTSDIIKRIEQDKD